MRDGREQAKSTGPVDGLQAAVRSELVAGLRLAPLALLAPARLAC